MWRWIKIKNDAVKDDVCKLNDLMTIKWKETDKLMSYMDWNYIFNDRDMDTNTVMFYEILREIVEYSVPMKR